MRASPEARSIRSGGSDSSDGVVSEADAHSEEVRAELAGNTDHVPATPCGTSAADLSNCVEAPSEGNTSCSISNTAGLVLSASFIGRGAGGSFSADLRRTWTSGGGVSSFAFSVSSHISFASRGSTRVA